VKPDVHPQYRPVVFQDTAADFQFLTRSTLSSNETVKWEDGNEYPLVRLDISAASHPFFTGKQKLVDTAGRVERFERRYAQAEQLKKETAERKARRAAKEAEKAANVVKATKKRAVKKTAAKKAAPKEVAEVEAPADAPVEAPESSTED